jgi:energy-coupling factor transport system ATP-binding protein
LIPSSGKIFIDGKDVSAEDLSEDEVFEVRKKIGMVFQNPDNQIVATIVEEDVAFGVENLGLPREEIRRRVVDALNVVGMQDYARHAPHKLSGGQKQRVAIAGIIAMKPRVIILDEATAMLDPIGRKSVIDIVEKLNREERITIVNITHYMEEAARADRVIVVNDGEMIIDGSPADVFSRVDLLHKIGLESPQGTELIKMLSDSGFDVNIHALGEDECVDTIFNAITKYKERR